MKVAKRKPKARPRRRLISDDRWLSKHSLEIHAKYHGKAIAIWHNEVIAVGRDAAELAAKADKIAPPDKWLLLCLDHERVDA